MRVFVVISVTTLLFVAGCISEAVEDEELGRSDHELAAVQMDPTAISPSNDFAAEQPQWQAGLSADARDDSNAYNWNWWDCSSNGCPSWINNKYYFDWSVDYINGQWQWVYVNGGTCLDYSWGNRCNSGDGQYGIYGWGGNFHDFWGQTSPYGYSTFWGHPYWCPADNQTWQGWSTSNHC